MQFKANKILYYAEHEKANSATVAQFLHDNLYTHPNLLNIHNKQISITENENLILVLSCWGDQELKPELEDGILKILDENPSSNNWILIEIGNHFGNDDFSFGATVIMKKLLQIKNQNVIKTFSIDSFTKLDQDQLSTVNRTLNEIN